ncbi:MAG: PEP-CTERM sorting domain-containing protein [Trichodesmium sp.]
MKINQFFQVVVVSSIMSIGFSDNLPAGAFVINSTENNSSLTTNSNSSGSSNLSEFLTQTSQDSQESTTDCNSADQVKDYAGTPEPTLISGLFVVVGFCLWSKRKKFNSLNNS